MSKIQETTLGKIGKVSMCKRVMKYQTNETGEVPFFKISTFGEKANVFICKKLYADYRNKYSYPKKGDILISAAGTVGKTVIYNGESAYFQDSNIVWIANDESKILNEYLYYFYQTKPWITTDGSTIKRLYNNNLRDLKINFPEEIQDQQKIAHALSTLDSKIELNNKINTELEKMAKSLYDYWFVQFDFPNKNGKPYKSSGGKMVYNKKLKREIPEGWEVANLKNNSLTKLLKPKIDEFEDEKTYLATADVQNNDINFQAEKITYKNRASRANMQPIENSIWFAKMKNSKKVLCLADYSKEFLNNFILSTGFAGLQCKENSLEYIWGFINNDRFEFIKDRLTNGATQEAINNDTMIFINLIIPHDEVLEKYHLKTKSIYQKIYNNQTENQKLAELRDWLLPMLMNGQVKVV